MTLKLVIMAATLVGGVVLAWKATAWANYYTFGANRKRLEKDNQDKTS
jgi:hypothetical protein